MEVISEGHKLKAYLYLRENIMLASFWDLKKQNNPPHNTTTYLEKYYLLTLTEFLNRISYINL